MFKSLFGGGRSKIPLSELPQLHSFVEVKAGGRPTRSVAVEKVGPSDIVTAEALGKPGETVVVVYTTPMGRYRFQSRIASVQAGTTTVAMPASVSQLSDAVGGAQKRSSLRMDALVTGQWRFAPAKKGIGTYARASIRDISRGGCSLILDRELPRGSMVEVKLLLRSDANIELLAEVMRTQTIETSGKISHGLRFLGPTPEQDHAILDFINKKQTDLRSRGLA